MAKLIAQSWWWLWKKVLWNTSEILLHYKALIQRGSSQSPMWKTQIQNEDLLSRLLSGFSVHFYYKNALQVEERWIKNWREEERGKGDDDGSEEGEREDGRKRLWWKTSLHAVALTASIHIKIIMLKKKRWRRTAEDD